ncbi:hypothetical protein BV25DRAFT_1917409 [Artomyces pyxidatus]|uniref:Uncharacterized protein n=1 Tax=Artomyces pyxidatus TaxID=48021 RepID=A0ACB8SYD7_9AGAM|nr:hypothetical protein BV25DRAFT_1917409 [Artomyces pyxidatus]
MGKKRKRSQREASSDVELPSHVESDDHQSVKSYKSESRRTDEETSEKPATKEQEIWESFKEEYHEALEQLPLYLHRSYALLRELDEQATAHCSKLLPSLQQYIRLRNSLAGFGSSEDIVGMVKAEDASTRQGTSVHDGDEHGGPEDDGRDHPNSQASSIPHTQGDSSGRAPKTTRELAAQIGWLAEEALRASEEKTSLAQAAYDSVDRHIRLLEQAIKEQEMSIAFGLRQGTHPALLPDLVVPRWARGARVAHSPIPGIDDVDENLDVVNIESGSADPTSAPPEAARPSKKKGKGKKKGRDPSKQPENAPQPPTTRLKLKVPPLAAVLQGDTPVDPNERRYCYCDRVSSGVAAMVRIASVNGSTLSAQIWMNLQPQNCGIAEIACQSKFQS